MTITPNLLRPTYLCCVFFFGLGLRSKHRKDSERRTEHQRDKMDLGEDPRDAGRHRGDHWRKRDTLETRCCYLCGSSTHIKKDCQLYRSPAGAIESNLHPKLMPYWLCMLDHLLMNLTVFNRQRENGKLFFTFLSPHEESKRKGATGTTIGFVTWREMCWNVCVADAFFFFAFRDYRSKTRIRKGSNKTWCWAHKQVCTLMPLSLEEQASWIICVNVSPGVRLTWQ